MFKIKSPSCGSVPINSVTPIRLLNDAVDGHMVFLHQTAESLPNAKNPYSGHFAVKKRRWELRLQLTFLRDMREMPMFGIEIDRNQIHVNLFLRMVMSICKSINRAKGDPFIYSLGKDGKNAYIFFPLWVMDTMIPTYPGETPPDICHKGPLPLTPQRERKQFKLDEHPNAIWTFVYFNAYIDFVLWELANVPAYNHASLTRIVGESSLRVILCHPDAIEGFPIEAYVELTLTRSGFGRGDSVVEGDLDDWESVVETWDSDDDVDWKSMIDFSDNEEDNLILRDADVSVYQLCGTYYYAPSSSHISTLVINSSGRFWHSLYIRSDKSKRRFRPCACLFDLFGFGKRRESHSLLLERPKRRTCAPLNTWRRGGIDDEKWEVLEVLGSWQEATQEDERGVILTLEQWRGASKCGLPASLREQEGILDQLMGKLSVHMVGSCYKGVKNLRRALKSSDIATSVEESPEEFGTLALLGFSARYVDQPPK